VRLPDCELDPEPLEPELWDAPEPELDEPESLPEPPWSPFGEHPAINDAVANRMNNFFMLSPLYPYSVPAVNVSPAVALATGVCTAESTGRIAAQAYARCYVNGVGLV
jgi:hypothetical protein